MDIYEVVARGQSHSHRDGSPGWRHLPVTRGKSLWQNRSGGSNKSGHQHRGDRVGSGFSAVATAATKSAIARAMSQNAKLLKPFVLLVSTDVD
ncbi:uncharacterized protein PHALS_08910 [Plasmopara halstedii]|uniref:Uncharacterized protein n=1 Tax=Plasmopara halstedii TaxID=4781 RepID=A0A0P1AEA3_PLAHL|nr:uncharacterized protein PHALS_08910 [Plasmopara halstedii]CEG38861.1 hypothetical protein PHALS_08910 [Plasmopara halstedii]|eukprot:XP_024575230.1 hypothetical protein PHALS_08910 [Plasmopara halstedii]